MRVPLSFLGTGEWTLHSFVDKPESGVEPGKIVEGTRHVITSECLEINLAPGGGYAAALSK